MTAYRDGQPLHCPACDTLMERQPIASAVIDVCPSCGGVWADRVDGDLATVATEARLPDDPDPHVLVGDAGCPRCSEPLHASTVKEVVLHRCRRCRGTFLAGDAVNAAMWLRPEDTAPPLGTLEALGAWLRYLFVPGA